MLELVRKHLMICVDVQSMDTVKELRNMRHTILSVLNIDKSNGSDDIIIGDRKGDLYPGITTNDFSGTSLVFNTLEVDGEYCETGTVDLEKLLIHLNKLLGRRICGEYYDSEAGYMGCKTVL